MQPRKFTTYERDSNQDDEAMHRRYSRRHGRFDQPDPYDGSYDLADPQSFNRYSYVSNDPVNFVDPTGLASFADSGRGWVSRTGGWFDDRGFNPADNGWGSVPGPLTEGEWFTYAPFTLDGGEGLPNDTFYWPINWGYGIGRGFFYGGGRSRQYGPHDPNSPFCKSLLQKIQNIRKDIDKRMDEFMKNPLNLPLQVPGGKLRDDQLGHLKIIMDAKDNLLRRIEEYTDRCGGPPPGVPVPGKQAGNKSSARPGINRQAAGKTLATSGGLVATYFILRTILRVAFPPSNLVPVP